MEISEKIKVILGATNLASVLGLITHFIQMSLFDAAGKSMLGDSGLQYILIIVSFYFWAFVLSVVLVHADSLKFAILFSFAVSFLSVLGNIGNVLDIYLTSDYSDRLTLKWEILQICSSFIIFSLIGFLIWFSKRSLPDSFQIQ
jgi:hypothetical protein